MMHLMVSLQKYRFHRNFFCDGAKQRSNFIGIIYQTLFMNQNLNIIWKKFEFEQQ